MLKNKIPDRKEIGKFGESIALDYLLRKGYFLVQRNYFIQGGEVDLIVKKDDQLVFVEVKTRLSQSFGLGESAVTPYKKYKLLRTIRHYLDENPKCKEFWRLDAVSIEMRLSEKKATLKHFLDILAK